MLTRFTFVLLMMLSIASAARAQQQLDPFELGARIGLNTSAIYYNETETITNLKAGLAVGGFVKFRFSRWIGLQPEILYSQQGGQDVDFGLTYNLDYVIVPVLLKVYPLRRLNVQIGPQMDFLVSSRVNDIQADELFVSPNLSLAFGVEYEFDKGLLLTLRYTGNMTNIVDESLFQPEESPRWINALFLFSAGWRF